MNARRLLLLFTLLPAALVARTARGVERNFAGSAQVDYHLHATAKEEKSGRSALDGFTSELALKLAVDVTERVSVNVKVCHGCHGFELPMAYFDYRLQDELYVRVGRFSPTFGSFNLRHDPANHATSSKPLPYDMGRMLRWATWNLGVLPSPFPDNGLELGGTHWFGDRMQLDYAVHAVAGFRASAQSLDLDWLQSLSSNFFLVDNNGRPAFGGRAALTFLFDEGNDLTAGLSAMHGTYDPQNVNSYTIVGADLAFRIGRTQLRAEYLLRRQSVTEDPAAAFQRPIPASGEESFSKHGYYVEVERPLTDLVGLLLRLDGLYRTGNLPVASPLSPHSAVSRVTAGATYTLQPGLRLKASAELWSFSNDPPALGDFELGLHLAMVGTF